MARVPLHGSGIVWGWGRWRHFSYPSPVRVVRSVSFLKNRNF